MGNLNAFPLGAIVDRPATEVPERGEHTTKFIDEAMAVKADPALDAGREQVLDGVLERIVMERLELRRALPIHEFLDDPESFERALAVQD